MRLCIGMKLVSWNRGTFTKIPLSTPTFGVHHAEIQPPDDKRGSVEKKAISISLATVTATLPLIWFWRPLFQSA